MTVDHIVISKFFLIAMVFLYHYFLFIFIDTIFIRSPRKRKYWLLVSLCNTALMLSFSLWQDVSSIGAYLCLWFLFFIEFYCIYQETHEKIFFISLAVMMHLMAIRAICVALFSLQTGLSIYEIVNDTFLLVLSMGITFFILNLTILLVLKLISNKKIKVINLYDEQIWFITVWLGVFDFYLLQNAKIYQQKQIYFFLNENQIIAPLAILLGLYTILFFIMKTNDLLTYKEKNWELQQEIYREQQLRNSIVSDALMNYEFNLTQDKIIDGFEPYQDLLGDARYRYSKMLDLLAKKFVHLEDIRLFHGSTDLSNLLSEFAEGKREVIVEYRSLFLNEEYMWVRAITNLRKDDGTGEIQGFTYIKNIDKEKKMQLELKVQAERDFLTGLYNKGMTGKLIADYLALSLDYQESSVLYIIDLDNFKSVNDYFGHIFGDVVLCELSEKLRKIFRSDDIVGRIGGDEFIAFMKNVKDSRMIQAKALEICKVFSNVYQGEGQIEHVISSSIGIVIFPDHGTTFEELYHNADVALYASKNKGKNTYTLYDGEAFNAYRSNRTAIDQSDLVAQKSFKSNRIEYVFKILYGSPNPISAVRSVLELLAAHFNFSRGYIFETSEDEKTTSNTFEWCAEQIEPQMEELQNIPIEILNRANQSFQKTGMHIMRSLTELLPEEYAVLAPQGIKAMMQFAMFQGNQLLGFIGFDDCINERIPTKNELAELSMICNILATFIIKQRAIEKAENNAVTMSAILNNLNSYAYVIDKHNYEILFLNEKTKEAAPEARKGEICYQSFRGNKQICKDCPIQELTEDIASKCTKEIYNATYDIWTETTATYIHWFDGEAVCLVNCIDITKYKCHN